MAGKRINTRVVFLPLLSWKEDECRKLAIHGETPVKTTSYGTAKRFGKQELKCLEETLAPNYSMSELVAAVGLDNGKSGLIALIDYITRAEIAVFIKRILDCTEK